jgi:microcystin-dependent protein
MKHRQLLYGHVVPQSFFDALQEFVGAGSTNLFLSLAAVNQVQIEAGPGNDQVAVGIDGLWRYTDTTITAAVTGPAGTYDLYVTCGENAFAFNPTPPPPEIDSTDYSFGLVSVAQGATPAASHFRHVGEAVFDGTRILALRQVHGVDGSQLWQPGFLMMSAGPTPPPGFLLCDGSLVGRDVYPGLFAAIGTVHAAGDGSTTFGLPDYRGCTLVGAGPGALAGVSLNLGAKGGAENVALSAAQLPQHNHPQTAHRHGVSAAAVPAHTHTVPAHTHSVPGLTIPNHSHTTPAHTHPTENLVGWSGGGYWGTFIGAGSVWQDWVYSTRGVTATQSGGASTSGGWGGLTNGSTSGSGGGGNTGSAGGGAVGGGNTEEGGGGNTGNAGGNQSHSNVQPFAAVSVFIKT